VKNQATDRAIETYEIQCPTCRVPYDALQSVPCECLGNVPTPQCPHCGHCLCRQPKGALRAFWSGAPPSLWKMRLEAGQALGPEPPRPDESAGHPLILVAEDEAVTRRTTQRILERRGYKVVTARDGAEALELALRYKPDLVLTDAMMPRMDGRELCRRIKETPDLQGTKVIVMTATYTKAQYRTEGLHTFRADAYLSKPVSLAELEKVLQELGPDCPGLEEILRPRLSQESAPSRS